MGCSQSAQVATSGDGAAGAIFKVGIAMGKSRRRLGRNDYQTDPTITITTTAANAGDDFPERPLPLIPGGPSISISSGSRRRMAIALYDFVAQQKGDLAFRKGDHLELLDDRTCRAWWLARMVHDGGGQRQGFVPSNYVQQLTTTLEVQDWYFASINRKESERALLSPGATTGCFIVRACETNSSCLALSVRGTPDPRTGEIDIRHYKIQRNSDGSCYLTSRRQFPDCITLIQYYRDTGEGMGQRLGAACPPPPSARTKGPSVIRDKWEIDRHCLTFEVKLGSGHFGEVWKGKYRGNRDVAIKTLKPGSTAPDRFLEEAHVMKKLQHEKLVTLHAVCTRTQPFYIVTELMVNGSLLNYLRDGPGNQSSLVCLIDMAAQVASGMCYLERNSYVHRDLAARNVLVGENNMVKVADFGLTRVCESDHYNPRHDAKFPIKWTAPEAALYGEFSTKSDVWSFGILLHEVLTRGQTPYPGMNNREVLEQVDLGYRMQKSPQTPQPMYSKMLQCWNKEALRRPTFQHLYNFLEDYFISTESTYGDVGSPE